MGKLILLVGVLLMMSGVLADISIGEMYDVYNLGDRLYVDLDGIRGAENGNLDIDLICGNKTVNMVRIPARAFSSEEDQTYSIPYKVLDRNDLGVVNLSDIVGVCQIVVFIGENTASSKSFEIKKDIILTTSLDKLEYNPGEVISISIEAVKANGVKLDGFVNGGNATSFNKVIEDGFIEEVFTISNTSEAGIYYLDITAYDSEAGGVLNEGSKTISYVVNQVASSLILSLSDVTATPGKDFNIGVEIFDQSGTQMSGSVFVKVISPEGDEVESVVQAGEFVLVDFLSNSSVGTWKIVSQFDDLVTEREFEMAGLMKAEFDIEESVLVVKNVGNILYNKTIDVNIGDHVMSLDLNIKPGEVRKFNLKAPVGNYEVVVEDGDLRVTRNVLLTGNAVSVSDAGRGLAFGSYLFVWIFLIVVIAFIAVIFLFRYRKTRNTGDGGLLNFAIGKMKRGRRVKRKVADKLPVSIKSYMDESLNFTRKSPAVRGLDAKSYNVEDKSMFDLTKKGTATAESALVLKGEKNLSGVVALNIKNFEVLGEVAREELGKILEESKGKGLIDCRGDYIFVVFSPLMSKTYKNEILAVKCAMEITEKLIAYNKKFRDKVEFGVGVHVGDLIASKNKTGLKYTGIGNTVSFAKRMSDVDSGRVVVSEVVYKKLLRELKVSKGKEIGEKATWVVEEILDRSGDAERLKQLLQRSEE